MNTGDKDINNANNKPRLEDIPNSVDGYKTRDIEHVYSFCFHHIKRFKLLILGLQLRLLQENEKFLLNMSKKKRFEQSQENVNKIDTKQIKTRKPHSRKTLKKRQSFAK